MTAHDKAIKLREVWNQYLKEIGGYQHLNMQTCNAWKFYWRMYIPSL